MANWIKNGFQSRNEDLDQVDETDKKSEKKSESKPININSPPKSRVHLLKKVLPSRPKKKRNQSETSDSQTGSQSHSSQREDCSLQ